MEIPVRPATDAPAPSRIADALTLLRALLVPVIMAVIVIGWSATGSPVPGNDAAELVFADMLAASFIATTLFGLAALTDVLDDMLGGAETSRFRRFGWFDDIADLILVLGTLLALLIATWRVGALGLGLLVPALVIVGREVVVGLAKGYQLMRTGWPQTALGTAKNALAMLSTLLLVASPWLTAVVDGIRAGSGEAYAIYAEPSNLVWNAGLVGLWVTAVLSVVTGVMILTRRVEPFEASPVAPDDHV